MFCGWWGDVIMCAINDADPPTVSSNKWVRARIPHKCAECGRPISVGERYNYAFMVYEGIAYSFRTCEHCITATGWLKKVCGGWLHEGLAEEIAEHAEEYPECAPGLLRMLAAMRQQWRRSDGDGLLPLPRMPRLPAVMVAAV